MSQERRTSPRIASRLTVRYSYYNACSPKKGTTTRIFAVGNKALATSLDISCGGMMLETEKELKQDLKKETYLDLRIDLEGTVIKATAKVVHSQILEEGTYGSGIKFMELSEEHRKILYNYVMRRAVDFMAPSPA